ncbi:MAG: transglutaminase domain-containing protein [Clostridia bacterium]|nr:transglutaminase domain-containing protein [Clostridia bacterium]
MKKYGIFVILTVMLILLIASCSEKNPVVVQTPGNSNESSPVIEEDSGENVASNPSDSMQESSATPSVDEEKLTVVGKNIEIIQGQEVSYNELITVTNAVGEYSVNIDSSAVQNSTPGVYTVSYTVTDEAGNTAQCTVQVTVKEAPDTIPPTVLGTDFQITIGDGVSYKKQIEVSDDKDPAPAISVDNSAVDLEKPGTYPVVYTVTDKSGNSTVLTLYLTIVEKEYNWTETEKYVYGEAEKILERITTDSMSDLDVAYAIYRWTKNNIGYWGSSDKTDWIKAAHDALKSGVSDCFGFFAVSKALLTVAEIDTHDMEKDRVSDKVTRHYWLLVNVGDGWYHFDTTRFRYENSNFFMLTNEEIWAWDNKYYPGTHTYITEGVPEVATKSIQDRVDYNSSTLKK